MLFIVSSTLDKGYAKVLELINSKHSSLRYPPMASKAIKTPRVNIAKPPKFSISILGKGLSRTVAARPGINETGALTLR